MTNANAAEGPALLEPGTLLHGRFEVLSVLGKGGMGVVYETLDTELGAPRALKIISRDNTWSRLNLKREFRVVADLRHSNLVRLFDLVDDGARLFYTMEIVDGGGLGDYLTGELSDADAAGAAASQVAVPTNRENRREGRPLAEAKTLLPLLAQLLDALEHLHANQVVHLDLKPANVLVGQGEVVKLADFGISRRLVADGPERKASGTIHYMAPEQIASRGISGATDVYGLGCTLYRVLTGRPPFRGSAAQILEHHRHSPPPHLELDGFEPSMLRTIESMLAKTASDRPSIEELRAAFGFATTEVHRGPAAVTFVGRAAELQRLEQLVDEVAAGAARACFICGESGTGKSALLEKLTERATMRDFDVFVGRCYERERVPFRAFDAIIDELSMQLAGRSQVNIEALMRAGLVFSALRIMSIQADVPPPDDPRAARIRAFEALGTLFASSGRPLLIAVDDLQWADAASIELMGALLEDAPRLLFVGLSRTEDIGGDHLVAQFHARAPENVLRLGPLSRHDLHAMITTSLPSAPPEGWVDRVLDESAGNPFFARQLVDRLARGADTIPASISTIIHEHIAALDDEARAVLEVACVAGGASQTAALRASTELDASAFDGALERLVDDALLRKPRAGWIDVYHDKIRERVYGALDGSRRADVHGRIAVALETLDPKPVEALEYNWRHSGAEERADRYARLAADAALERLAFERAAELLERLANRAPSYDVEIQLARACELMGDHVRAAEAFQRATKLAETDDERRRALLDCGAAMVRIGRVAAGEAAFNELLAPYGLRLGTSRWTLGALALRRRLPNTTARRAASDDERFELHVYRRIFESFGQVQIFYVAEFQMRYELLARELDDADAEMIGATFESVHRLISGESVESVQPVLDRARDAAARATDPMVDFYIEGGPALAESTRGAWQAARQRLTPLLERQREAGRYELYEAVLCRTWLLIADLYGGREEAAIVAARELERSAGADVVRYTWGAWGIAIGRMRLGDLEEADAALARWGPVVPDEPTAMRYYFDTASSELELRTGAPRAALDRLIAREHNARRSGCLDVPWLRPMWFLPALDAAVALQRRGELAASELRWVRKGARKVTRVAPSYQACVAEGFLAVLEGSPKRLQAGLTASEEQESPYSRWLVLAAAHAMGAEQATQVADRASLEARYGALDRWGN